MNEIKIYVAGHSGTVGSSVMDVFRDKGYSNIITKSSSELDLRNQEDVEDFVGRERPDAIVLTAGRVEGELARDQHPYQYLYDKLAIQNNMIHAAHKNDVDQLIFLGSSCFYPRFAPRPLREPYLLTGSLEPANQWYAIAKMAGIKLCETFNRQYGRNYTALIPADLYGAGEDVDSAGSKVIRAMIRKFHDARERGQETVRLSGTATDRVGFLNVRDLADAILFAVEAKLGGGVYNIGTGEDPSMKRLAHMIQEVTGHRGGIIWDRAKSEDELPAKRLDVSKIQAEGWRHKTDLGEGLAIAYHRFLEIKNELNEVAVS
ncbi:GDP-L-fucose synthase [Fodinibius roseus]|uniref:GDP-L-fucose synthase n=1 Tax=Fodinibius roseus TaxID=1194090 RepID=A0A1M4SMI6_9BACT|nr:NAD-dependent epimerase/dehydratase family protein [Fodinibius roseus]SHE33415.1 GDP-L-fucose synthase [Fodinibius roseus]